MTVRILQVDQDPSLVPYAYESEAVARAGGELILADCTTEAEVMEHGSDSEILWLTWRPVITPAVMRALPRCRLIVRWGVGYDQIDVAAASELGIAVANAPSYGTDDVAEHAIALLLSAARRVTRFDRGMRRGEWPDVFSSGMRRVRGRTLGIVGLGRIGSAVAARARGLGLNVVAVDIRLDDAEIRRRQAEPRSLSELLGEADYVSLHVPLTSETTHLIDSAALARLKPGAVLVNTSRGPVVDQAALLVALEQGRLAGAALDVFEQEPLAADSPLRSMEQVILTPHAAGYSLDSWEDLRKEMCDTAADWIAHGWSENVVNPEVRPRLRPRELTPV
jgi:D-3-phosphoglycerate dehydrogenase